MGSKKAVPQACCIVLRGMLRCHAYLHRSGRLFHHDCVNNMESVYVNLIEPLIERGVRCDVVFAVPAYYDVSGTNNAVKEAAKLLRDVDLEAAAGSRTPAHLPRATMSICPPIDMSMAPRHQLGTTRAALDGVCALQAAHSATYDFVVVARCDVALKQPLDRILFQNAEGVKDLCTGAVRYLFRERHAAMRNLICDVLFVIPRDSIALFQRTLHQHRNTSELHSIAITAAAAAHVQQRPAFAALDSGAMYDSNTDNEPNPYYTILRGAPLLRVAATQRALCMPTSLTKYGGGPGTSRKFAA